MDWQMLLFSTSGRITRSQFWLAFLIYVIVAAVASVITIFIITSSASDLGALVLYIGGGLVSGLTFFSAMAVSIKRLHDRNRIGWWNIPMLVLPILLLGASNGLVTQSTANILVIVAAVLGAWGVIEFGLLRGSAGENRFGADPLAAPALPAPGAATP